MDYNEHYKEIQELIKELGITITDDTKPTELFTAVVKILAGYAAKQPTNDEIADYVARKIQRDMDNVMRARGLR